MAQLIELDASHNRVRDMSGAARVGRSSGVEHLTLAHNHLDDLAGVGHLRRLRHLLLQGNRISSWAGLALPELRELHQLRTLYLQDINGAQVGARVGPPRTRDALA